MPRVIGVDGCSGGWLAALVDGTAVRWRLLPDAAAVLAWADEEAAVAVGIDIPIGVPGSGGREVDLAARDRLGSARSSVFLTPPRPVLAEVTFAAANARCRELTGQGLSQQSYGLFDRIRDVDRVAADPRLVEVHPELSFRAMGPAAGGPKEGVTAGKKTARGAGQRIAVLRAWLDPVPLLADAPTRVPLDDALDALAAAWSAQRWAAGAVDLLVLPRDPPPYDDRGIPMRMAI